MNFRENLLNSKYYPRVLFSRAPNRRSLKANRLKAVEDILAVSSRLIVNPASLKLKRAAIAPLIESLAKAAAAGMRGQGAREARNPDA